MFCTLNMMNFTFKAVITFNLCSDLLSRNENDNDRTASYGLFSNMNSPYDYYKKKDLGRIFNFASGLQVKELNINYNYLYQGI
jgi:hypothetical protein